MSASLPTAEPTPFGTRPAVLVYDGDCGFCQWTLDRLQTALPALPRIVDGRRGDVEALGLDLDDIESAAWLVTDGRGALQHHKGADAFGELMRRQPSFGWRFAGNLIGLPGVSSAAHLGYRVVARNRHRLPGATAACAATAPA